MQFVVTAKVNIFFLLNHLALEYVKIGLPGFGNMAVQFLLDFEYAK